MIKRYILLAKPGIIIGNLIAVVAGFFLAAHSNEYSILSLIYAMLGSGLVIGSACVANNIFDSDIDGKMSRTKNRDLVQSTININVAFTYTIFLLIAGSTVLYFLVNPLATILGLLGYIFYVFFYTMWYKRTSIYGTVVGSISGAIPPIIGYAAVTNAITLEAVILFLIFTVWQMPHSYAISTFRVKDYIEANIPVFPAKTGLLKTQKHIQYYTLAFCSLIIMLYFVSDLSLGYLILMSVLSVYWARVAYQHVDYGNYIPWSKSIFKISLVIVMAMSGLFTFETLIA
ncbi:heme o synthase [Vibrio sp. SS-MA-C1-2]|uniref:heme o synthase n=1 Tax=Vibrio sp. SS-MA-C1-2 TaxID=2908646 RepID=UPI001F3DFC00|nr:heme o synthase [Vibrio sp. SS-MA-C1-2]UJF17546.1 heme o synthase [Vibrio sp. SS-MA-C1-2]